MRGLLGGAPACPAPTTPAAGVLDLPGTARLAVASGRPLTPQPAWYPRVSGCPHPPEPLAPNLTVLAAVVSVLPGQGPSVRQSRELAGILVAPSLCVWPCAS